MTPTDVIERFAQLLSTGDVGAAVELYEPEAAFAVQPGELAVGRTAIGAALVQFAALRPMLTSDIQEVVDIGDLALVVNRWTLDGRDPDGNNVEAVCHAPE